MWSATYLPFGQEWNPQLTANHYKFTGKERDSESGLDNFGARYDSSQYGRFMSVDLVMLKANRLSDPQRLNLYTYALNNPLRFVDPDGRDALDRLKMAGAAALNIGVGIVKVGGALAAGAATPETGGVSAVGAAYLAISASGNFTAAGAQIVGAVTGKTEVAAQAADVATTVTSVSGAGTLVITGGDLKKASAAAAVEGLITTDPKDLTKGNDPAKLIKAADFAKTVTDVTGAVADGVNAVRSTSAPPPPPPPPPPGTAGPHAETCQSKASGCE